MAWQPDAEQVKQLAGFLRDSLQGRDQNAQKYATMMLSKAQASPDYGNYLTYILSSQTPATLGLQPDQAQLARTAAAISLKNHVKARYKSIQPQSQAYIQSTVVEMLEDPVQTIRNSMGSIISEIVLAIGIFGWPEIITQLVTLAKNDKGSTGPEVSAAAASALVKICEDNIRALDIPYADGNRALDYLVPQLILMTQSPSPRVRAMALEALNIFLPGQPKAIMANLDNLSQQVFSLALDSEPDVRRYVCRALVQLLEIDPTQILKALNDVVTYMLGQQKDEDSQVALEAAEFWLAFGEQPDHVQHLGPYIDKIIPALLESMVYSEDDQLRHEAARDDANEEDDVKDIKPVFAKSKSKGEARKGENGNGEAPPGADDLSEGEIEDFDEEAGGDPEDEWTLRKCSAAALDVLANKFHGPVFNICMPWLQANFVSPEWPKREASVLAIGAISEGCMEAITPNLPQVIPFLINLLSDPEPVVRKITCWTLGRYSKWAAFLLDPTEKETHFVAMMDGLLRRMLDGNKAVQEAAASAFSSLEESAGKQLVPYTKVIVTQFVQCFNSYKTKNMYILYDCVQTLAENLGEDLAQPALIEILMPALMKRFNEVSDDAQEVFPLLECFSYVAPALGQAFAPYAPACFQRCVKMLSASLEEEFAAENHFRDRPDKDFRITTLDLLSSIIQSISPENVTQLIASSQPPFIQLLIVSMKDKENDVRQSAFALLGDTAKYVWPCIKPDLANIMPLLIGQLDADNLPDEIVDDSFAVINNACWSCGEIALIEKDLGPYLDELYFRLSAIILNPGVWAHVQENACIALGRLGIWNASVLAPKLNEFGADFIRILKPVEYTEEKAHAFLGLNRMILQNPQAMESTLLEYFAAAAKFADPVNNFNGSTELEQSFKEVILVYRSMITDFNGFIGGLQPKPLGHLQKAFGF